MSYDNIKILRSGYECFARGEIGRLLDEYFAPDIEWIEPEAEGSPFGGVRNSAEAVVAEIFAVLPRYFREFSVEPERFVEAGEDGVIVTGRYRARSLLGLAVDLPFVHQWQLRNGLAVRMEALTNTAVMLAAISPAASNQVALESIYDALSSGRLDNLDALVAADVIDHNPEPGQGTGLAGMKQAMSEMLALLPALQFTPQEMIACGDRVVARVRLTGGPVAIDGIDIVRFEDGLAVERWGVFDSALMAVQLGRDSAGPPLG